MAIISSSFTVLLLLFKLMIHRGVFSGILTMTTFSNKMGIWVSNSTKRGWLTSIFELGAWLGCLYSGFLSETLSRKRAIILNVGVFVIGVIVQACAVKAGSSAILGGRFVTGQLLNFFILGGDRSHVISRSCRGRPKRARPNLQCRGGTPGSPRISRCSPAIRYRYGHYGLFLDRLRV